MPHILAIDQSTSATKAILFDSATGALLDKRSIDHLQIYPKPGWVEHDAEEIWQNTVSAVRALKLREAPLFVSITNQRETVVVFDRATGRPLHHALVWQDRRGDELCARLNGAGKGELVTSKTGLKIDSYFSASKLAWLIANRPDIAAKLRSGEALMGTIDCYLIHRLTGGRVFATDHTNASRTLLFDIGRLVWDEQLCGLCNVPTGALPEVRDSTARFGETDFGGAIPSVAPICGVMGDSQASLFAHRCFAPGSAKVTLGSGSSVLLNLGEEPSIASDSAVTTIAWTHRGRAVYSFEGIINYTGATIQWLKDQLGLIRDTGETEALAQSVPDNGGVYFVPAFGGLSAPYWSPDARAAIVGMTGHTTRAHIVRAALESIAYQIHDVLEAMGRGGAVELSGIHADGGATRNGFLMQFIADITARPIHAARVAECSPLGAAMAGMLGTGVVGSLEALSGLPRESTAYNPVMPRDRAETCLAGWQRAVAQVLWATPVDCDDR